MARLTKLADDPKQPNVGIYQLGLSADELAAIDKGESIALDVVLPISQPSAIYKVEKI